MLIQLSPLQIFHFKQMLPSWSGGRAVRYNSERGPPKDHRIQILSSKCEKFTTKDGLRMESPSGNNRSHDPSGQVS